MNWLWGSERRRTLTPGEKKYLLLQAKGKCEYCGENITARGIKEEIHHIVPWASRGSDNYHNLIVLCPNCHSKAEYISKEEFRLKIEYRLPKRDSAESTVSKATPKKAAAKKSTVSKPTPKKAAAKKTTAKKTAAKKTTAKKTAAKKTTAKKTTAKKTAPKKAAAKKTAAKKTAAKK